MSDTGGILGLVQFLLTDQDYEELPALEAFLVDSCVRAAVELSEVADDAYRIDQIPEGHGTREQAESFARSHFQGRVNDLLRDWRTLPRPTDMTAVAEELQRTVAALNTGAASGRAGAQTTEGIHYLATQLDERTPSETMAGATIAAFRRQVVVEIPRVAGNCGLLAIVLGKCMTGQATLWSTSRTNVARLVKSAGLAAGATASDSGGGGDDVGSFLTVLGTVLGGAAAFGGPAAVVLGVTGAALQVGGELWPAGDSGAATPAPRDPYGLAGGHPDEVLDNLAAALEQLNGEIRTEEDALDDRLGTALEVSGSGRKDLDLRYSRRLLQQTDDDAIVPEVAMLRRQINRIATHDLPDVADQLGQAAKFVDPGAAVSTWYRPEGIGGSFISLSQHYEWVAGNLETYLRSSEADVLACATHLETAANIVGQSDEAVADALAAHAREVRDNPLIRPHRR